MKLSVTYPPLLVLLSSDDDDFSLCEGQFVIIVGLTVVGGFHPSDFVLHLENEEKGTMKSLFSLLCL